MTTLPPRDAFGFFHPQDEHEVATLVRWAKEPDGGTSRDAARFLLRMLIGGLLMVALAWVDFLWPGVGRRVFG